jgi:glycosyltransferase
MIDILIPSYNDERIIRAIGSITQHVFSNVFRIIIQDGGSDDHLIKHIGSVLRSSDKLICEADNGIFDALNKLLDVSDSDWIGWIGADDLINPDFNPHLIFETPDVYSAVSFTTKLFDDKTHKVVREFRPTKSPMLRKYGFHLPHFSTFIRHSSILDLRFDPKYKQFADQLFFIEFEKKHLVSIIPKVVSTFMAAGGTSNGGIKKTIRINRFLWSALKHHYGYLYSCVFVTLKALYKFTQIRKNDEILF